MWQSRSVMRVAERITLHRRLGISEIRVVDNEAHDRYHWLINRLPVGSRGEGRAVISIIPQYKDERKICVTSSQTYVTTVALRWRQSRQTSDAPRCSCCIVKIL